MKKTILSLLCLIGVTSIFAQPSNFNIKDIDIPYKKFVLDNGLTVLIHEDHKAPIVAFNVWYHVGSKNEKVGKTGFAHLFEHLMFNGSEHHKTDYFKAVDKLGATDLNGTTSNDRTNYFENVPTSSFDQILWLESDRMGYMVNAIDQATLDEQRGVVQNEKRQGENEPYGRVWETIGKATYPVGHPYSWEVIGSMEDLNAASLADVKEWFKTYYGPNNATVVIAGDINTNEALEKVKKYFGGLQAGPPVTKYTAFPAKMTGTQRQIMQDRVPQARLHMVWNIPEDGNWDSNMLDLVSSVLSGGKTSRLYKRLVYTDQLATSVSAYAGTNEIAGQFMIMASAKPGVELSKIEAVINEELAKFLKEGPTAEELEKVKTKLYSNMVQGFERIGGFGGKSDVLATYQTFHGDPDFYKVVLQQQMDATPQNLKEVANKWLTDGLYVLEVVPFKEAKPTTADVDRTKMPELGVPPTPTFPKFQKATLSNGLNIILAERKAIPAVNMVLTFDAGYAADFGNKAGTNKLLMNMLDEGTKTRSALQVSEDIESLGSRLSTSASLDQSYIFLNSLKGNVDKSLAIFADVLLNPTFPEKEFDRLKKEMLVGIKQEKSRPNAMVQRVFPRALYGNNHVYSNPFTGSGTEASVSSITKDDLLKAYKTWLVPSNATLIVVGDISINDLKQKMEVALKDWKKGTAPKKQIANVDLPSKEVIYFIDRPQSQQSTVLVGNLTPAAKGMNEAALDIANAIIGGEFTSRINMNIREDKHWTYGAGSYVRETAGQQPFLVSTAVQSDKTKETIQEIERELKEYVGEKPATVEEITKNQNNMLLQIPGNYETGSAVLNTINKMVSNNLKDSYPEDYAKNLKAVKTADVQQASKQIIKPGHLTWVVVGDKEKVLDSVKSLGLEVIIIDADGNPVK